MRGKQGCICVQRAGGRGHCALCHALSLLLQPDVVRFLRV